MKELMMQNYVPRTSLRWVPESNNPESNNIGGNEEIEYEKKIERNEYKGIRFYL